MSIKESIVHNFYGECLVSVYHQIIGRILPALVSDEKEVKKTFKKLHGIELNLENPVTFCDKLNWYKLNVHDPLMTKCADKYGVREYIKEKGYGECLNELYGVYDKVEDIDIDALPDQFVLKAAHGTHMGIIVKDKKDVNWSRAKITMKNWLKEDIYWRGREWVYKDVPHRIVAEAYMEDSEGELKDYKFFCFNGVPEYMQYDIGRFQGKHYRNYYDMNMNLLTITDDIESCDQIKQPLDEDTFTRMQEMARVLSSGFQEVRVDFYYVNKKIIFGEMTFYHNGGYVPFVPDEWNTKFSQNWIIKK